MLATPTNETDVVAGGRAQALAAPLDAYTRGCAALARACMWTSVFGLVCLIVAVTLQIVGRHVLNSTPTWAESLALLLVLYVTMLGAAVGVRDAGHIGFESLLDALPPAGQRRLRIFIHLLVLLFGVLMAWNCGVLAESVAAYKIPNLGISNAWKIHPRNPVGHLDRALLHRAHHRHPAQP